MPNEEPEIVVIKKPISQTNPHPDEMIISQSQLKKFWDFFKAEKITALEFKNIMYECRYIRQNISKKEIKIVYTAACRNADVSKNTENGITCIFAKSILREVTKSIHKKYSKELMEEIYNNIFYQRILLAKVIEPPGQLAMKILDNISSSLEVLIPNDRRNFEELFEKENTVEQRIEKLMNAGKLNLGECYDIIATKFFPNFSIDSVVSAYSLCAIALSQDVNWLDSHINFSILILPSSYGWLVYLSIYIAIVPVYIICIYFCYQELCKKTEGIPIQFQNQENLEIIEKNDVEILDESIISNEVKSAEHSDDISCEDFKVHEKDQIEKSNNFEGYSENTFCELNEKDKFHIKDQFDNLEEIRDDKFSEHNENTKLNINVQEVNSNDSEEHSIDKICEKIVIPNLHREIQQEECNKAKELLKSFKEFVYQLVFQFPHFAGTYLFMNVLISLLGALYCEHSELGDYVFNNPEIECWGGIHFPLFAFSLIFVLIYYVFSSTFNAILEKNKVQKLFFFFDRQVRMLFIVFVVFFPQQGFLLLKLVACINISVCLMLWKVTNFGKEHDTTMKKLKEIEEYLVTIWINMWAIVNYTTSQKILSFTMLILLVSTIFFIQVSTKIKRFLNKRA